MPGLLAGTQVTTVEELIKTDRTSGQVRRLILLLSGDIEENPGPDQRQRFEEEKLVVLTSNVEIDMRMWRVYLEENFTRLTRQNSKVFVLGGIHGGEDGRIGERDKKLFEDNIGQLRVLKRNKDKEIRKNKICFENIDLGEYLVNGELNEEKLVGVIKEPTLIILAYCYTNRSEVDDILRAAGVYAAPILI